MKNKADISSLDDIKLLVNSFYTEVKKDDLLGPIFMERVHNWDTHLETMYKFWESILLDAYTYKGTPFAKHADLPVNKTHFDRWVHLFGQIVDENFKGTIAENAKSRAAQFGTLFWS